MVLDISVKKNAKILAGFFISIEDFSNLFDLQLRNKILNNLVDLDGIGETQIQSIKVFFLMIKILIITKNLIKKLRIIEFSIKN